MARWTLQAAHGFPAGRAENHLSVSGGPAKKGYCNGIARKPAKRRITKRKKYQSASRPSWRANSVARSFNAGSGTREGAIAAMPAAWKPSELIKDRRSTTKRARYAERHTTEASTRAIAALNAPLKQSTRGQDRERARRAARCFCQTAMDRRRFVVQSASRSSRKRAPIAADRCRCCQTGQAGQWSIAERSANMRHCLKGMHRNTKPHARQSAWQAATHWQRLSGCGEKALG